MPKRKKDIPVERCKAKARSTGNPCKNDAIPGGTVCYMHGGQAPQVAGPAAIRAEVLGWKTGTATVDPSETMLRMLTVSWNRAEVLGKELDAYAQEHGMLKALTSGLARDEAAERERVVNFASKAVAANLGMREDARKQLVTDIMSTVLRGVLGELKLTPEQMELARPAVARNLALVKGAGG